MNGARPNGGQAMRSTPRRRAGLASSFLLLAALPVAAQDADDLAKKLSNPVAELISVPLQYNIDFAFGPEDGTKQTLNVQPVIPASLDDHWNLITRVILPVIYQDDVFGDSGDQFGLGDTTPSLFFSPKAPTAGGLVWAVGPVFLLPTATDDLLGSGKWGAGPTALVLWQKQGWSYGALANHVWSFAGDEARGEVSSTFLQPFLSKGIPGGWTVGGNLESTYNWDSGKWTVPLNLFVSKVTKLGSQLVSLSGGARCYVETPGEGPDWGLRAVLTLLFPK